MIRSHKNIYYSSMLLSYVRSSKQPRKATKKVFSQDDDNDEGHFGSGLTFVVDDKYQQQQFQICEWCAYGSFYSCYDARKHSWIMICQRMANTFYISMSASMKFIFGIVGEEMGQSKLGSKTKINEIQAQA